MAEGSGQERTEEATPRRKQQARKRGSVAKSPELVSALILCTLLLTLPSILTNIGSSMVNGIRVGSEAIPTNVDFSSLQAYIGKVGLAPFLAFIPLAFIIMGVSLTANFAQVGFLVSSEALQPKWERLNPFAGCKRLFSRQAGMEGLKAMLKSVLFSYLAYSAIIQKWDDISSLSWKHPSATYLLTGSIIQTAASRIGIAWLVLAGLDYFFQRKQLDRSLKMTKEEVKQEFKETEQSPELKMAMARRRRQMSKGRPLKSIKDATVVVTNPTHYAVAIKYDPGQMHAPVVVAKGVDFLAARIREEAKLHNIPIVPNPPLARRLHKVCEVGDFVPREMFQAVAEVLAFIYRTLGNKSQN